MKDSHPAQHLQLDRDAIRNYYEQNTPLFLRFARSEAQTIHRAVWGKGVNTITDALNHTNELLLREINALVEQHDLARIRLADLGCGIGGSAFYLLPRLTIPGQLIGATISRTQAEIAQANASKLGLARDCLFVEGDFLAPPLASNLGAVYSIEAFCHATSAELFLAHAARLLMPGGKLILCDDFLSMFTFLEPSARAQKWLEAYQKGWFVPNLRTVLNIKAIASEHNLDLVGEYNLTPLLKLRALPEWLANFLLALGQRVPAFHPIVPSMLGSMALQQCLKMGWVEYRFLVFEKS